jgi:hypothetical protein
LAKNTQSGLVLALTLTRGSSREETVVLEISTGTYIPARLVLVYCVQLALIAILEGNMYVYFDLHDLKYLAEYPAEIDSKVHYQNMAQYLLGLQQPN